MAPIKFGWRTPGFPADSSRRKAFIDQITTTLQKIDGKFDSFWIPDHFVPWPDLIGSAGDMLECWTTICYLAAAFPSFDVGSMVMSQSFRNPALLAKMAATLQLLSGGRLILGIGAGWKADEHHAYNYDFPRPAVRIRQLEETVQIIRKLWTEAPASFNGKYYQITNAYCEPRPDPMPPILIGGGGEALTLRVVAQHADWWNADGSLEAYGHKLAVLRSHCDAVGRDYDEIVKTWAESVVSIAETEAEGLHIGANSPFKSHLEPAICTPDRIVERLQQYVDLGVTYFIIRFADFPSTAGIELFAEQVIPRLR